MAVTIRMRRVGRRNRPMFRVVAADSRSPRDGRFLETLGYYHPLDRPAKISVDIEKTLNWLREGAQPSDTVRTLFKRIGMMKIWRMAQKNEDYSHMTLSGALDEKAHKPKAKARAHMNEQAKAKDEPVVEAETPEKTADESTSAEAKPE